MIDPTKSTTLLDISNNVPAGGRGVQQQQWQHQVHYTPRSPSTSPPPPLIGYDVLFNNYGLRQQAYLSPQPSSLSPSPSPQPPSYASITMNTPPPPPLPPPPPPSPSSSSMTSSLPAPQRPIVSRATEGLILAALDTIVNLLWAILDALQRLR